MLRSSFCSLAGLSEMERMEVGECPFDQGGYFVINGSEKVLIAQERMANNHVYCFRKSQPSKYQFVSECRSIIENSTRSTSTMSVNMTNRARKGGVTGSIIVAQIPYIKSDINVIILFRALGFVADKVRTGPRQSWRAIGHTKFLVAPGLFICQPDGLPPAGCCVLTASC